MENPVNDARAVASMFERLHFDKVIFRQNLGIEGFRSALMEISREAVGAKLAVVYFAGHGAEFGGRNYLIPVDAGLAKAGDLDLEAIALDTVLSQLAGVTMLKLVILDACRNNMFPFAGSKRSGSRGLGRVEPAKDTLVWYAAKDGTTAEDGVGRPHSPFTDALLKRIGTPGLELRFLVGEVRDDVLAATGQMQEPHIYGSLGLQLRICIPVLARCQKRRASNHRAKRRRTHGRKCSRPRSRQSRLSQNSPRCKLNWRAPRPRRSWRASRPRSRSIRSWRRKFTIRLPCLIRPQCQASTAVNTRPCMPLSSPSKDPQTDIYCIEPEAARADFELGVAFRESIRGTSAAAKRDAIAVQRQWILERNLRCPATWDDLSVPARRSLIVQCLIAETYIRIRQLRNR